MALATAKLLESPKVMEGSDGIDQGLRALSYLLSGPLFYGFFGWLIDQWLHTSFWMVLGIVVGMAAGVALAAALPELPWACGLGTLALLTGDVVVAPVAQVSGELRVSRSAPVVAEELVDRWDAGPARTAWWRDRVTAAYGHVGGATSAS